ncbi:hypothetical protein [Clostridium sp.]|uniref:hypothetical protein n=1 Tax=Clostridium sp. TaxID=1506 RepID=UPI003216DFD4
MDNNNLNQVKKQNAQSRTNSKMNTSFTNDATSQSNINCVSDSTNFSNSSDESYLQEVRRQNAISRATDPTYQEMYSMFGMGEKKNK